MKEYILALYSKLLYEKWYDNKYRNQKIATLILTIRGPLGKRKFSYVKRFELNE